MKTKMVKLSIPAMLLIGASYLQATTLKEVVEQTMTNNPKIMSTIKNDEAYRLYIDEAEGGYYPKLDLTTYIGTKNTKSDPDDAPDTDDTGNGFNAQLDFEQLIYDGGLTSGQIDEAQYRYNSNRYLNQSIVDDIIFDSIDSYLNLVKYKNRVFVAERSIAIYNDYLVTAKETEEISGEALQKAQVNAKIHYANNFYYEDTNNNLRARSSFIKNVGIEPDGKSCRPNLNDSKVPTNLKELIDEVLVSNPLILEAVENIKEQRAILNQKDANFYPTIKFKAQAVYDDDLIEVDEKTEIYSARIELTYNIFNGNRDQNSSLREKIFLEESQKKLDTITTEIIDETTAAYNTYMFAKKRSVELQGYLNDNKNILAIYKDQFEGGTRTFIDVLNIERDLALAEQNLVDVQYELDSSYYQIFNKLGLIKESVLESNNDTCTETKKEVVKKEEVVETTSEDVQAMLAEDNSDTIVAENVESVTNTYGLYLVAYKNSTSAEKDLAKASEILGETYNIKLEKAGSYTSVVVYNIPSMDEVKTIKTKLQGNFPGSYTRKFTK